MEDARGEPMSKKENKLFDLRNIRTYFEARKVSKTVKWLDKVIEDISADNPFDADMYYTSIFQSFKEYIEKNFEEYPRKVFDIVERIFLVTAIGDAQKFRNILVEATPIMVDWRKTQENLKNISQIVNLRSESLETDVKFYMNCFLYLIVVEGSYENWIKLMYFLLYNFAESPTITYDEVEAETLNKMKKWLIDFSVDDVLFEGYQDGHLRNAIAHAHLEYNISTKKMIFTDLYRGEITYQNVLSLDEFLVYLSKCIFVVEACIFMMMMMRLRGILSE